MTLTIKEVPSVYVMDSLGDFVCPHLDSEITLIEEDPQHPDQMHLRQYRAEICTQCGEFLNDTL